MHLAADAAERVVIINTYLALMEGEQPLSEKERAIVLNQVFRHATTGLFKDDAAPPVPTSQIAN